jgi:Tfp pilus assembly protein FimV
MKVGVMAPADSKSSTTAKAAPADPAPASTVTAGVGPSNDEVELRARMAELDQENRHLRAQLADAGVRIPEKVEQTFAMSEGVRQDLILLRHRVDAGELKEEDAKVADPVTSKVYTLADLPKDANPYPGIGDGK